MAISERQQSRADSSRASGDKVRQLAEQLAWPSPDNADVFTGLRALDLDSDRIATAVKAAERMIELDGQFQFQD